MDQVEVDRHREEACHTEFVDEPDYRQAVTATGQYDPMSLDETEPKVRTELAGSLHFILSQYLKPSTLRRLIAPREAMLGRALMGRSMQGEVDDDLLARILAQAVVEHIRQSGFVVKRQTPIERKSSHAVPQVIAAPDTSSMQPDHYVIDYFEESCAAR